MACGCWQGGSPLGGNMSSWQCSFELQCFLQPSPACVCRFLRILNHLGVFQALTRKPENLAHKEPPWGSGSLSADWQPLRALRNPARVRVTFEEFWEVGCHLQQPPLIAFDHHLLATMYQPPATKTNKPLPSPRGKGTPRHVMPSVS